MEDRNSNTQLKLVTGEDIPDSKESKEWKEIRRERLINSLNKINFQEQEVVFNFENQKYGKEVSFFAKPQPCFCHYVECSWSKPFSTDHNFENYKFKNFYYADGLMQVLVDAALLSINKNGVILFLPENGTVKNCREVRRHKCSDVVVQLFLEGLIFKGKLVSFSPVSFTVNMPNEISSFNVAKIADEREPINIIFIKQNLIIYTGKCEIVRISETSEYKNVILKPVNNQIQRFKSKKYRSIRKKLLPSPNIIFKHPLTDKIVNLRVSDISGAGFSVEENRKNSLLASGLIIPDVKIEMMNGVELKCSAQVIYRKKEEDNSVKCGLTYLDMPMRDQIRLSSLLDQVANNKAYVCTKVDIDELWDFFFEAGFIYPQKYMFINSYKQEFKKINKKLYEDNPDITINFMYRENGKIYGHMAMLRFYHKTWIIYHHAAISSERSGAGLVVLEQVGRFINEFYRLPSTKMDYVACYFRPDNKFPNLVFGGAARNSSKGCTVEEFGYMLASKKLLDGELSVDWSLKPSSKSDLVEVTNFYEKEFNGLTLKALDICPSKINCDRDINEEFNDIGLKRERLLFSLKNNGDLIAVFMVNISELGINMSDLTNCIHVFVVNSDKLTRNKLYASLSQLSHYYDHENLPVLLFPKSYTEKHLIPIDKTYNFWVLDVEESSDEYFAHVNRLTKRIKNIK